MTETTNGSGVAKTQKELLLEHDKKLDEITAELSKAKGALYLAVLLGLVNVVESIMTVAPAVTSAATR